MIVGIYNFRDEIIEVSYFQLLKWRGAISLESKGLKHSRGSVTAHVRRKLSAPRNYPRKDLLQHLNESIESIKEQTK